MKRISREYAPDDAGSRIRKACDDFMLCKTIRKRWGESEIYFPTESLDALFKMINAFMPYVNDETYSLFEYIKTKKSVWYDAKAHGSRFWSLIKTIKQLQSMPYYLY